MYECDHTARVVDDLLLLSRIDAGVLRVEAQPVDLAAMLTDLNRQVGRLADAQNSTLYVWADASYAQANPTRLRQVVLILLDNALRYTEAGGTITVTAQRQGRYVRISVADTGCGIAADHLQRLFDRFYRVDQARGVGKGVGLGLSIAHALITAQHGYISVQSSPGQGAQFSVDLLAVST